MRIMRDVMNEKIRIMKNNGNIYSDVRAHVGSSILVENVEIPIEIDDVIEQILPSGITRRFAVDNFKIVNPPTRMRGIRPYYSISYSDESRRPNQNSATKVVFDQRNQHVAYQYNAAGNISLGAVENRAAFSTQLEALREELAAAERAGAVDDDTAIDADFHLSRAADQAAKPDVDKSRLLLYLQAARDAIQTGSGVITATSGLLSTVDATMAMVHKLFS